MILMFYTKGTLLRIRRDFQSRKVLFTVQCCAIGNRGYKTDVSKCWDIRTEQPQVKDGVITHVELSGDFFFYPAEQLENLEAALAGALVGETEQTVARFYEEHSIESPGVTPADFAQVMG